MVTLTPFDYLNTKVALDKLDDAIEGGGGGGSLQSVMVAVSSAQILSCFEVPVIVVPAPGAGKFICLISVAWSYTAGDAAFNSNSQFGLFFTDTSATTVDDVDISFMNDTVSLIRQGAAAAGTAQPTENGPVIMSQKSHSPTVGNGSLVIYCDYTVKSLV